MGKRLDRKVTLVKLTYDCWGRHWLDSELTLVSDAEMGMILSPPHMPPLPTPIISPSYGTSAIPRSRKHDTIRVPHVHISTTLKKN